MYEYIEGKITSALINYIVIDVGGVGYKVYVPNPYKFNEGENYKVYIYNHIREDEYSLYGFMSFEERELFLKLINVKGMGPKMTMPILATGSVNGIIYAIDRENILYLKKFPKIGDKLARQIILDLKGKLASSDMIVNDNSDELVLALEALGYKGADIKKVISHVNRENSVELQIKEALKLLLNS